MEKKIDLNWKQHGKAFEQFTWMVDYIKKGKTVEIHGPAYVVLSRKRYEDIMRQAFAKEVILFEDEVR